MASTTTWQDELMARTTCPCRRGVVLAPLSTFRIGGPADVLAEPTTEDEAINIWNLAHELGIPVTVLGGGSNVLIGDGGIRGLVIRLAGELAAMETLEDGRALRVGAGASFPKATKACMALGFPRSHGWVGTPGTVGGALIMNAGSREGEIGEVVDRVRVVVDGKALTLSRDECGFAYRHSAFPQGCLILEAVLRCPTADRALATEIQARAAESLARRKASQPREHSAGSLFKNPVGGFAGKLIQEAGLKGLRVGGAMVSPLHANFLVNTGNATARDVVTLATQVQAKVEAQSGVKLEWEVKRIGEFT